MISVGLVRLRAKKRLESLVHQLEKIIDHFLPMYIFPRLVIANKVVVVVSTNKQIENGGEGGGGQQRSAKSYLINVFIKICGRIRTLVLLNQIICSKTGDKYM